MNNNTVRNTTEYEVLEYILFGSTICVIIICIFWIWYYISSYYINKCDSARVNTQETTNAPFRLASLKAQRTKISFFISIIAFELLRKCLSLLEYIYIINFSHKEYVVEVTNRDGHPEDCSEYKSTSMHELAMRDPAIILVRALNLTAILCLISLVGITMLYLSKMYRGERKLTSVNAMVIILALKAVFVLILSSTIVLMVAGIIVWIVSIIFDWFLICIFAGKLIKTISITKRNQEVPLELKLTATRNVVREYRTITFVTLLVVVFVFIYVVAQVAGITLDIADLVIIKTCYFWRLNIEMRLSTGREISDYLELREIVIIMVYSICLAYNLAIIFSHLYFSIKNYRRIGEKLFCRQKQVLRYDFKQQELEEPLLNDNAIWTDETYVKKLGVSSSNQL